MDPNANLSRQLELAEKTLEDEAASDDARELAELVLALHGWIKLGGFLPVAWYVKGRR